MNCSHSRKVTIGISYKKQKQRNNKRMKYYCIKQHDITDCGAACLATICRQNGYKIGISKIREVAGTDKQGTNAYSVIKAAEQLGFCAKGVKC
jgi:ABC-type bacteriocin/lantibiotic exporter with double-glycine peptidase domain